METMKEMFRRMNFFKGFFTQAGDWAQGQEYHIEKHKFHNRYFHTPGVVFGCLDDLRVTAGRDGTSLNINPGLAVDGYGRELYLPQQEKLTLILQNYRPPGEVYVIIRFHEEKIDLRPNESNPEYSDYAFVQEKPLVEVVTGEPDNAEVVELAHINLSGNVSRVRDARDPISPREDEIDMTRVRRAGVKIGRITLDDVGEVVKEGEISVVGGKGVEPREDDTNVLLEKVKGKERYRFFQVSAYSEEDARISSRIESSFKNSAVEYRLYFKNFSGKSVKVFYKVYRLNSI